MKFNNFQQERYSVKKFLCVLAVVALAGCSSAKKDETTSTDASGVEQKVTEATSTDTTAPAEPVREEKATKKQAKEVTTSPSADSAFPSITGTEKSSVTCTNKGDSRKISVLNVTEGGCGVVYNKMGEDKTVAMAKVDMNYCDTVSGKIKSNLEGAGFDCGGGAAAPAETSSGDTKQQ